MSEEEKMEREGHLGVITAERRHSVSRKLVQGRDNGPREWDTEAE